MEGHLCILVFISLALNVEKVTLSPSAQYVESEELISGTFPKDFIWSSATSAYQIEGAWNISGKGPSIWDTFVRVPGAIVDGSTGDVACDSYNRYEEDIKVMKEMGVSFYRFSISWPRVMPDGTLGSRNQAGINYYKKLISSLKEAGIKPMGTLYHWDLPQALEDHGGWLNESAVVQNFADYSRLCFQEFGNDIKYWITHNEPWVIAYLGYGVGSKAPGIKSQSGVYTYLAGHNLLKSHAEAYHIYHDEFISSQQGQIGITLNVGWAEPEDKNDPADLEASERSLQFDLGWFAHPVFINGDYPDVMKWRIGNLSEEQNLTESRLPQFTENEKKRIKGTSDFFGLNYYSGGIVTPGSSDPLLPPSYDKDKAVSSRVDPSWPSSGSSWLYVAPFTMRRILNWIREKYNNPPVYITENGVSDNSGTLEDDARVYYLKHYINNVLKAIEWYKCDVRGYTGWSLLDNFEWERGYAERFGLHYVNFSDPMRPRIAKKSAKYYKEVIMNNGFPSSSERMQSAFAVAFALVFFVVQLFSNYM